MSKPKNLSLIKEVAEHHNAGRCLEEIAAIMNIRGTTVKGYFVEAHARNLLKSDTPCPVGVTFGQSLNEELSLMLEVENRKDAILLLERQDDGVLVRLSKIRKPSNSASMEDVDRHNAETDSNAAEADVASVITETDSEIAEEDLV